MAYVLKAFILAFFVAVCGFLYTPFQELALSFITKSLLLGACVGLGGLVIHFAPREYDQRFTGWFILSYILFVPVALGAALVACEGFSLDNIGALHYGPLGAFLVFLFVTSVLTLESRLMFAIFALDDLSSSGSGSKYS